jgi:hypothetical protein
MVSADHAATVSAEVAVIDPELLFQQVRTARLSMFKELKSRVVVVVVRMLSKESLVKKLTHSTVRTALVEADVVTKRVATERATGERMPKLPRKPWKVVSRSLVKSANPVRSASLVRSAKLSLRLSRRKLASLSMTTSLPSRPRLRVS